jgi:hypothetical protein
VYFEEESNVFGDAQDDFSFTMTDPSGKYFFDINPEREIYKNTISLDANPSETSSEGSMHNNNNNNDLFVAHYVNDASFADFSPIVNAAKKLRQQQQQNQQHTKEKDERDLVKKGEELDTAAARLAVEYLGTSTGTLFATPTNSTRVKAAASTTTTKSSGFNVVMCAFSPPPLMAYVTIKPVQRGEEFLASYGLGYWLGNAFPEDGDEVLDAAVEALEMRPEVRRAQHRAETVMEAALEAGDEAVRKDYGRQTRLIPDTFTEFRRARREETHQKSVPWWKRWRLRRGRDKATE